MTLMAISRYPRPGHPLAPIALKPILTARIPKKLLEGTPGNHVLLCDLDISAWETLSPEVCQQLGKEVVDAVREMSLVLDGLRLRAVRDELDLMAESGLVSPDAHLRFKQLNGELARLKHHISRQQSPVA